MNFVNVFVTNPLVLLLVPVALLFVYGTFKLGRKLLSLKRKSKLNKSAIDKAKSSEDIRLTSVLAETVRLRHEAEQAKLKNSNYENTLVAFRCANAELHKRIKELRFKLSYAASSATGAVKTLVQRVVRPRDMKNVPDSDRVNFRFKCVDCRLIKRARVPKNTALTNNKGVRTKEPFLKCVGCYRKHLVEEKGLSLDVANKKVKEAFERWGMTFDNKKTASGLNAKGRVLRDRDVNLAKAKESFSNSLL